MSAVSDVIAMIIIVVMLLSGWALIQFNQLDQSIRVFETNKLAFEQHRISADFGELLQVKEPTLKMSMGQLMGDMAYSWSEDFNYYGQSVSRKKILESVFDSYYGKENYYMEVLAPQMKVRIYFIVDGSASMKDDLEKLNRIIPEIRAFFKGKGDFIFEERIFIQKNNLNPTFNCESSGLVLSEGITCVDLPPDRVIPIGTDFANQCPKPGKGIYNEFFSNSLKNPASQYFVGNDAVPSNSSKCDRVPKSFDKNVLRGEFYEDWATATAYVAKSVPEAKIESSFPTVTFIFPASDELSSGSEDDSSYNYAETGDSGNWRGYFMTCRASNGARSLKLVNHAISVLKNYDYKVFPIFTDPRGNFNVPNYCNAAGNNCQGGLAGECQSCMGLANCPEYPAAGVHARPQTIDLIRNQMKLLAGGDGSAKGDIIDCSAGGCDPESLKGKITSFINNVIGKKFEFGAKKEAAERYSVVKTIPLKDGTQREVKIWVYKKQAVHDLNNALPIELKPVPLIRYSPINPVIIVPETDIDVNFWSNSFDPLGGKIVSWVWQIDKDAPVSAESTIRNFKIAELGDHNVTLTIANDSSVSNSARVVVRISDYNYLKLKKP